MFFALSKIAALFLKPLFWAIVLLVGSFVVRSKRPKWSRGLLFGAVLVLLVFSNPVVLRIALRSWEVPAPSDAIHGPFEIGIVLGGYSNSLRSTSDRLVLGSDPNRLSDAVRLYKTGTIKKIVLTGGTGAFFGEGISEAPLARNFLLDLGIPDADILVEHQSRNTHENAILTANLFTDAQKRTPMLLVTSAIHMRRARFCFEKAGFTVVPFPTDFRGDGTIYLSFRSLLPDAWTLWQWEFLLREWAGTVAYRITGRA